MELQVLLHVFVVFQLKVSINIPVHPAQGGREEIHPNSNSQEALWE
jgi:hypothetical protein